MGIQPAGRFPAQANGRLDEVAGLLALAVIRLNARRSAKKPSNFSTLGEVSSGLPGGSERASDIETQPGEAG